MKRVLMSDELFEALGASRVEWGEPDADGFYTPTVYRSETPRDGRESNVADPEAPLPVRLDECPDSRSSQAASPRASQVLGDL